MPKQIFAYDPIRLHLHAKLIGTTAKHRSLVPSVMPLRTTGTETCWSGWCPGCGKTLISACDAMDTRTDHYYCTRACREAHT